MHNLLAMACEMRDQSGSQTMTVDANDPRARQEREILREGNVAGFGNGNVDTGAASSNLPAPPLPSPLHPPTTVSYTHLTLPTNREV